MRVRSSSKGCESVDRQTLYSRMKSTFLSSQTLIKELDEPGVIYAIFQAVAGELEELYKELEATLDRAFVDTAQGHDLDRIAALLGVRRKQGSRAVGVLRFYRDTPADRDYLIPKSTRARTPLLPGREYLSFETTQDAVLQAGQTYVDVPAQSVGAGAKYNVAAGSILVIETPVQGAVKVTNPSAFTGGTDPESDEELRARIPLQLDALKRATADAIRSAVLAIEGVQDVIVQDGSTPGTVEITVVGTSFDMSEVEAVVEQYKGAGIQATVQTAATVTVDATFDLYVASGYDSSAVKTAAEQAVTDYLNGLGLGQPAQIAEVIVAVMKVEGVDNVKNVQLNGATDDVVVNATEKIVAGTVTAAVVA